MKEWSCLLLLIAFACAEIAEGPTDAKCTDKDFACEDGSGCIRSSRFCGGEVDCKDGSDEIRRPLPLDSNETGIPCRRNTRICLLPKNQQSKQKLICTKDVNCTDEEFACEDGSRCIPLSWFCDGGTHCKDGSDEKRLQRNLSNDDIMCDGIDDWSSGEQAGKSITCALSKKHQCDGKRLCKSGDSVVDECLCVDGDSTSFVDHDCFRCLSNRHKVIPITKLCDGIVDCSDLSDECLCKDRNSRPELCNMIVFETTEGQNEDVSRSFLCNGGNTIINVDERHICDGRFDCDNKVDELSCRNSDRLIGAQAKDFQCPYYEHINATRCDGKPTCFRTPWEEECSCDEVPRFCRYLRKGNRRFRCLSLSIGYVWGSQVCDGIDHCNGKKDEVFCTNRTHFYCHDDPTSYVLVSRRCDQKVDCADESDEQNCEENFRCFKKNASGTLYIHRNQLCDGTPDCAEGADECLSRCITSAFSSTSSLIKNKGVLGCLYTISSVALCGNIMVFFMTMRMLLCPRRGRRLGRFPKHKRDKIIINRVLILSLAISDALVVIYTMAICIQSSLTEGKYCLVDQDWRSGSSCSALGSLLLIGSEQSVFTMILITVFRLYTIWRPYGSVSVKKFSTLLALTWIISISLGMIPLLPHLKDTFTTSIWYKENKLFSKIEQTDVEKFTYWLLLMNALSNKSHSDIGSWSTLEKLIGEMKPNFTASRRFGFYSDHTVCIPDLFPVPANTASWWYSVLLIIINFIGFLVIAIGYFLIYRRATKNNPARDSQMDNELSSKMQKRLAIIITTDFLCWMPVCIMAFLQLSGIAISNDLRLVVGMIIIPINSAFNPIIYSGVLSVLLKKCKQFRDIIRDRCIEPATRHIRARRSEDIELNSRNGEGVEQQPQRVIEEAMVPVEIYASDSAGEEGVVIRETSG